MATLEQELASLTAAVAAEFNALRTELTGVANGNLTALTTTGKTDLISAINEINAEADANASALSAAATLNDTEISPSTNTVDTYSIQKITADIASVKSDILGSATGAYDTLVEIQAILQADDTETATILTEQGQRVAVNSVQTFTAGEQTQARSNIGALSTTEAYIKSEVFSKAELGDMAVALAPYFATQLAV